MDTVSVRTLIAFIKMYHPFATKEEHDDLRERLNRAEQSLVAIERRLQAQERKP